MAAERRVHWKLWLMFAFLAVLAAAVRLYRLGEYSLWLDEAHTWFFTQQPWPQFFQALRLTGVHPPFYFMIDKGMVSVFGDSEFALRIFSVVVDLVSIALAARLGWQYGRLPGSLAAAWFWAFNPFTVWFGQEARPYALAALLALAGLSLFLRYRENFSTRILLLAVLVLLTGFVTHFFFFLAGGALILLSMLEIRTSPKLFRQWTLVTLLAMLPLGLWVIWFFVLEQPVLVIGWIPKPSAADPFLTVWNFLSGFGGLYSLPSTLFGGLAAILVGFGLARNEHAGLNRRLLLAGVLAPLALTWLVSFRRAIYVDRYFIVLLPFVIPAMAAGSQSISDRLANWNQTRWVGPVLAAGFLLVGIVNAWQVHIDKKYLREDWKGLAAFMDAHAATGSKVWFHHLEMIAPFEYAYHQPYKLLESPAPPHCTSPCFWALRQPYTPTHAFTQSVTTPGRPWLPALPPACEQLEHWYSPTGIAIWEVVCR